MSDRPDQPSHEETERQDLPPETEWGSSFDRVAGLPAGIPEPTEEFRSALLASTARRAEAHGDRRRLWQSAAALLIFGCGWWFGTLGETGAPLPVGVPAVEEEPETPPVPTRPEQLERALAAITAEERPREWLRAGDAYLSGGRTDPSSALYCYRQGLEAGGAENEAALAIDDDDSWLLKALKVARK